MAKSMTDKLIRVLIVDDEEIVRNGLHAIIDWNKNGCEICGEASTGEEALEKIKFLKPQIVLLDINMPVVSGIDILAEVHNSPEKYSYRPSFLILSGYSDFDYAQKAINYGAKGYIVKPVDEDVLEEKIVALVKDIKREEEAEALRSNAQQEAIVKEFRQMLVFGIIAEGTELNNKIDSSFQIALVSPELCGFLGQMQIIKDAVDECFSLVNHFSFFQEPSYVVVFKDESEETILRCMERFCFRLQRDKKGAVVALGSSGKGYSGALMSYREARNLYEQLFFYNEIPFVSLKQISTDPNAQKRMSTKANVLTSQDFLFCIPELVKYIEVYDLQRITGLIEKQSVLLKQSNLSNEEIKKLCMAFIVELQNALQTKHPEKQFDTVPALDLVNLIYTQNYYEEMITMMSDFVTGLAESFTSNAANSTLLKVVQYVKTNYNTELRLEMLGDLFNCNSAYLGKKFKEFTGVSFNTYLDIIRIEAAKKMLLESDLKIYDISKLVGYRNTDYFYLKFKHHTNETPKEFKLHHGQNKS